VKAGVSYVSNGALKDGGAYEGVDPQLGAFRAKSSTRSGVESMAKISLDAKNASEDNSLEGADRRRAERSSVTVRIDYSTVDEMFSEFTRDINAGGLFIETEKLVPAGTEVSMQFNLPGSNEVLQTIGRVVRVSNGPSVSVGACSGMGVEFDELTSEDRLKIDRIVRGLRSAAGE